MNKTTDRCNEALAHHRAGRLEAAESLYHEILAQDEGHAETHHNLGVIEIKRGDHKSGLTHLRRALELAPGMGGYWLSLAEALLRAEQFNEAHTVMEQAKAIGLDSADARLLRERITIVQATHASVASSTVSVVPLWQQRRLVNFFQKKMYAEGEVVARRLIDRYPDDAFGWKAAGTMLLERHEYQDALTMLLRAISIAPHNTENLNTLGNILQKLNRLSEALDCCNRALEIDPDYAACHNTKGEILKALNRPEEAIASVQKAIEIDPNLAQAHNNLGVLFSEKKQFKESLEHLQIALTINPEFSGAYTNLASLLLEQWRWDEGLTAHAQAINLAPENISTRSIQLFGLNYHPDKSAEDIFAAYRDFNQRCGEPHRAHWQPHANNRDPMRRLRIGYVSPDFRGHSVRNFLEPLLAHHDKSVVDVTAYAELTYEDAVTARYRSYCDHWVPTKGLSDAALAERIRADGIDILVDLAGHTANNRLGVFARRPAPISVSWLGYGYTTGLSAIDYFLTDAVMVPPGSEHLFAEQPWRIATPSLVYRPTEGMGEVGSLPALNRGYVTFGTLTRGIRINHRTIRVWSAILQQIPDARLIVDSGTFTTEAMQTLLAERFAAHGIDRERLEIGCHSPPWDVLHGIDIGLDCFPHNSGTTLIESVYMGVPFITLAERPSVGRIGSMILAGAGHAEWIAASEDEYIEKAVALASDLEHLATIRANLRDELENGPWRDEAGFARRVEQAYREINYLALKGGACKSLVDQGQR